MALFNDRSFELLLLDFTAAFDTDDCRILLSYLEQCVGIKGIALKWSRSFLTGMSFSVQLGEHSSSIAPLTCGVPRGSVLGPALFSLYMLPLGSIFKKYNISKKKWLSLNFFSLNYNKTEVVVLGQSKVDPVTCFTDHIFKILLRSLSEKKRQMNVALDLCFCKNSLVCRRENV
uniref:Uncharacterized protein n=1 Tax=Paramormyrops kingsleyae TaxID=1676925 RepID=A0A3B3T335_9TELE